MALVTDTWAILPVCAVSLALCAYSYATMVKEASTGRGDHQWATWAGSSILSLVAGLSLFALGGLELASGMALAAVQLIGGLAIWWTVLRYRRHHPEHPHPSRAWRSFSWLCLLASLVTLGISQLLGGHAGLAGFWMADGLIMMPSLAAACRHAPNRDEAIEPVAWAIDGCSALAQLIIMQATDPYALIYPVYLVAINFAIAGARLLRQVYDHQYLRIHAVLLAIAPSLAHMA